MLTIVETPTFQRLWPDYWTKDERAAFASGLALSPEAGAVVPGSGGVRKVRWSRPGSGKRGGVRVVYFNRLENGKIWLLLIYPPPEKATNGRNGAASIPTAPTRCAQWTISCYTAFAQRNSTRNPPSDSLRVSTNSAPCHCAMALTMASPRPLPGAVSPGTR